MRNTRDDVVATALRVLDANGLEFTSMRRVAAALDVQPSALYHHVPNKQTLLALMADEIVDGVAAKYRAAALAQTAREQAAELCRELRRALLAVRDGADVVATAVAFRLGGSAIEACLAELVGEDGARTLLLYTFGQAQATQTQLQAEALGALPRAVDPLRHAGAGAGEKAVGTIAPDGEGTDPLASLEADLARSFDRGVSIIIAGITAAA